MPQFAGFACEGAARAGVPWVDRTLDPTATPQGDPVTTVEEARPRVQRMLERGYGFERIEEEIEAIEGLDVEARSAIWVWAWMCDELGRSRPTPVERPTLAG